jgi:hypothetical protein
MTSIATLVERLRRATGTSEPERDIAVILSEFVDDGGVELIDDPFHPARKAPVEGPVATLAVTAALAVVLERNDSTVSVPQRPVPQRHGLAVVVAALRGPLAVDVFIEEEDGSITEAGSIEILPAEVHVIEEDVVHRVRLPSGEDGLALHVVIGDLRTAARCRWIDGVRLEVTDSAEYPLGPEVG